MKTMNFLSDLSEKSGNHSVKDAACVRLPKTSTKPQILEKVKNWIATDARFGIRLITTSQYLICLYISPTRFKNEKD